MIRALWVGINLVLATVFFGLVAIFASLLRVRGGVYTWATSEWARAVLWASGTPVSLHGAERVDWREPQVLVCNHVSWYDVFAIAAVLPVGYHFVAKKELERIPLFGMAWKAAGHISIDRSNRQSAVASLRRAGEKIRSERGTVVIFPEGTRSRTGELQPFKKGAFVLAIEAGVPIVPTVVRGSFDIMPPGRWVVRPRRIHLHFCAPVPTSGYTPDQVDVVAARVRDAMLEAQRNAPGA